MGKRKLAQFAEVETFHNIFQPPYEEVLNKDFKLKGKWKQDYFKNNNPITLELGCGKGEYTVGLAQKYPNRNFVGVDIKGARMWRGCKTAVENNLTNVAFVRTRVEFIDSFFSENEVNEIWITFPDPQLKNRQAKKRLTSSRFLSNYQKIMPADGLMHLKTDSKELFDYTNRLVERNKLEVLVAEDDVYNANLPEDIVSIKTHYEQKFVKEGKKITYTKFKLSKANIIEPNEKDE